MPDLIRMSLSLEKPLFDQLERLVARSGYTNRSEYIRDVIRDRLVRQEWDSNAEVLGTITLLYDHHQRRLGEKLTDLQHEHYHAVLASTHVHLTHDLCAEVILVRDKARVVRALADGLRRQKGVLHAALCTASTGTALR